MLALGYLERVRELVSRATISREFCIPYLANRSSNGRIVYIDYHVPWTLECGINPDDTLPWHELAEWLGMNDGLDYETAHKEVATPIERYRVEELGGNWDAYQKDFRPLIHGVDREKITRVPEDLDMRPYADDHDRVAIEEILAAQNATKGATMPDKINFFMPFGKVEKNEDGSRLVQGYASTPTKDLDGEIVSLDAIKTALPAYMEWRNIRQMHQPIAVGTAKEANVDDDGLYLTARIVDEKCIKLIDEDVLKGFSIGGKKLAKNGDTITELELIEISVVDRPANPDCRFEALGKSAKGIELVKIGYGPMGLQIPADDLPIEIRPSVLSRILKAVGIEKREFSEKERESAADSGAAMPDGSYPIKNKSDLKNAIQAFGRAKNKAKVKAHIKARARALGATDMIPDNWKAAWARSNAAENKKLLLAKGLGDVGRLANLIMELKWLSEGSQYEQNYEEDESEVPGKLRAACEELCEILKDMVEEETSELVGTYPDGDEEIAEAARVAQSTIHFDIDHLSEKLGGGFKALVEIIKKSTTAPAADENGNDDTASADVFKQLKEALMGANDSVEKKFSAEHKGAISKAAGHLAKAMGCAKTAASHMNKAAAACMAAKAANKSVSIEELIKSDGVAGHIEKAHVAMEQMDEHHDMASHFLGKVHKSFSEGGPDSVGGMDGPVSEDRMTEGEVPEYDPTKPYPGKAAGFTKEQVAEMIATAVKSATLEAENAALKQQNEALLRQPSSNGRPRIFAAEKAGVPLLGANATTDAVATLYKGVNTNPQEPGAAVDSATTMLTNMFAAPQLFGKSVMDPSFKGSATKGTN